MLRYYLFSFAVLFVLNLGPTCFAVPKMQEADEVEVEEAEEIAEFETEEASETQEKMLRELMADPYVKEHLGWMLVIGQHPMYLLIDEDRGEPTVGERVPPWGAKTKEDYVERVRRNLNSLEKIPQLKINYQWSALELQHMCEHFPDIYEKMKEYYRKGQLDFVDGSYSQAHLQVLTSESNWRQFEYGQKVYKELFDKNVDIYARQETGLHDQVPQLLRQFGYKFAAMPAFHAAMELVSGRFELIVQEGLFEPVAGDDFINWVALDGSTVPLYVNIALGWGSIRRAYELQQDMYSAPKIISIFPDLDEVPRHVFEEYSSLFDWVLLREGLEKRFKAAPPRGTARFYCYWSYLEGVWAEELMRTMRKAEDAALLAEQLYCMAKLAGRPTDKSEEIRQVWKTILKSQHHDISWIEVTDLKRKSINRLKKATDKCNQIMAEVADKLTEDDNDSMTVFNGLPRARNCLVRLDGKQSLKGSKFQQFKGESIGFVDIPAGGFTSFGISHSASSSKQTSLPEKIKTNHYSVELSRQGLMTQITARDGTCLLKTGDYLGGEIKARIDKKWVNNRNAECSFYSGPVCDILERKTSLADISLSERYYFFKDQPFIKVEIEFDFNGNTVGYMWFDETKINVYYPTRGSDIYNDIPFGYIQARESRPIFATNWLYCGGLAYVNRGTVKHWVKDGVIANVIAWGSTHFTNRLHWDWVDSDQYDIRLYGKQKIEYFLIPLGKFDGNKIVQQVNAMTSPVYVTKGKGQKSFYEVKDKELAVTSVYEKDGQVRARGYKLPSDTKSKYRNWEIVNIPITNVKQD